MAEYLLRWLHYLGGITWIGLLYYFNFVQGPFMAEADPAAKSTATQKLLPRALRWLGLLAPPVAIQPQPLKLVALSVIGVSLASGF